MRHADAIALIVLAATAPVRAPVLTRVADVPLPGAAVRFDYQSLDTTSSRLWIAHMNAGEVVVFDVAHRRAESVVPDLPRTTGVWAVPALGQVYASVAGRHQVAILDAQTASVVARVGSIGFPDGIAYAPGPRRVFVSDESGGGELVIDAVARKVLATIPLGGEAGNTLYDPTAKRILVAVQTRNEVVEIDPVANRVTAHHPLPGSSHPHGMAIDPAGGLLFVASEESATLQTVDLRTMRVLAQDAVGDDPDVLAFDPAWRRLYVAAESGVVTVFTEHAGKLVRDGTLTMPHAHTVCVDPRTHLVYFPLQDVDGHPVLRIMSAREP